MSEFIREATPPVGCSSRNSYAGLDPGNQVPMCCCVLCLVPFFLVVLSAVVILGAISSWLSLSLSLMMIIFDWCIPSLLIFIFNWVCMGVLYNACTCRDGKMASDPLNLELQMVVLPLCGAGNQTQGFWKSREGPPEPSLSSLTVTSYWLFTLLVCICWLWTTYSACICFWWGSCKCCGNLAHLLCPPFLSLSILEKRCLHGYKIKITCSKSQSYKC